MGNDTSKPPTNYNQTEVHEQDYLQTYTGGTGDKIDMGTGINPLSIGVKILRSVDDNIDAQGKHYGPGEMYVEKPNGRRVYLTQGGTYKNTAQDLVTQGAHFNEGPAILIDGSPGRPTYTVFSSTSTAPGSSYTPMTVNNIGDLQKAIWFGHENETKGRYASSYGSAAVNPFKDRPRNAFSSLADIGRGALKVVDVVALPIVEYGLDELTGGIAGTAIQVSGLDNFLQQGLDQLTEMHGLDFQSSSNKTAPYMSNKVVDPRLNQNFDRIMQLSRKRAGNKDFSGNRYQKELQTLVNSRHDTPAGKMLGIRKLQEMNLRFSAQQHIDVLAKTVAILKKKVPNAPNIRWDLIQQGLENASDPRMQVEFAETTTQNLIDRVIPFMHQQEDSAAKQQVSTTQPIKKPENTSPDPTKKPGSGFINGAQRRDLHPTEIKGFIPSLQPLRAF